jgi:hypothetical protein
VADKNNNINNIMRHVIIFILLIASAGCKFSREQTDIPVSNPDIRIVKEYYPDGSLKSETEAKGTLRHGITKVYSESGKLVSEISYVNNLRHGKTVTYYDEGNVSSEINYMNGLKEGDAIKYYPSGQIYRITPYSRNSVNGTVKTYWEDGILKAEALFKNGQPGIGLKEYTHTGVLKKMDAAIIVREIDEIAMLSRLTLRITLSSGSKNVEFFRGRLTDNIYWNDQVEIIVTKDGQGNLVYYVSRGSVVVETVNIIARIKTSLDNYYIIQKEYNLAAENKSIP